MIKSQGNGWKQAQEAMQLNLQRRLEKEFYARKIGSDLIVQGFQKEKMQAEVLRQSCEFTQALNAMLPLR